MPQYCYVRNDLTLPSTMPKWRKDMLTTKRAEYKAKHSRGSAMLSALELH